MGKTRLADRLARRTPGEGTAEVGSATMERRTRRGSRLHGFRFLVVPGDNAATRLGALDQVFHDEPVDGVLHVVANGHATPRRTAGTTGAASATREEQLAAELEDWTITPPDRRDGRAPRRPGVARDRRDQDRPLPPTTSTRSSPSTPRAAAHPSRPRSTSCRALAGGARLSVDVLPVAAEGGDKRSGLPQKEADALVEALATRLGQLSGHV